MGGRSPVRAFASALTPKAHHTSIGLLDTSVINHFLPEAIIKQRVDSTAVAVQLDDADPVNGQGRCLPSRIDEMPFLFLL